MLENGIPSILVSTILTYSTESYNIMGNEYRILLYIEYYNIVLTYSQSTKSIIFYTHSPRLLFSIASTAAKNQGVPQAAGPKPPGYRTHSPLPRPRPARSGSAAARSCCRCRWRGSQRHGDHGESRSVERSGTRSPRRQRSMTWNTIFIGYKYHLYIMEYNGYRIYKLL